jgi:hypothetical protein
MHTRSGYEVPGMILLQAYLCTYSSLTGVSFEVITLSSYTLSSTMLPLLETFLEFLLCNSSQYCRDIFYVFNNTLKSSSP